MKLIDEVLTSYDWEMLVWYTRYGGEAMVILGPRAEVLECIEDLETDADHLSCPVQLYLAPQYGHGKWLPYGLNESLSGAIEALEQKIASVPNDKFEVWLKASREAYDEISLRRARYWNTVGKGRLRYYFHLTDEPDPENDCLFVPQELSNIFSN